MARYLSKYSAMKKTVIKAEQALIQGPQGPMMQVMREPVIAIFQKAGVTPWERQFAAQHFGFVGLAEGEDPLGRISSYDTDEEAIRHGWSPEQKIAVEELLDRQQSADYFRVEKPRTPAPWPNYDEIVPQGRRTIELVAAQIAETVQTLGIDPEAVIVYELENKARPEVLEALSPVVDAEILVNA